MPKARSTTSSSDLRTTPATLDVAKITHLQGLREQAQKQWKIRNLQPFFPAMEQLFKLDHVRMPFHYGLKTKQTVQTISSPEKVFSSSGQETPVHRKTTMVLSPFRWMRGDFGSSGLPVDQETSHLIRNKLQTPHNAAYVGGLIATALSETGCLHFPVVYGTYVGLAEEFQLNISDDYEDLCDRPWFVQNIGHTFELRLKEQVKAGASTPLCITNESVELDVQELEPVEGVQTSPAEGADMIPFEPSEEEEDDEEEDSSHASTDYIFEIRSCSSDGSSPIGQEEEEEEPYAHAVFRDVQVQTTVMEKCTDTLYHLFKANPETEKRMAWLGQVVMALTFAQRNFGFVHNDLHVNNIMYVPTTLPHLLYNVAGVYYRIPTYGYIMKIIDFDRATYSIKLPGMRESRFFMSDQFQIDEEAGGQYNTEPFYNNKYPEIKPNASFDLVRLATSLFWDCFPLGPFEESYQTDALFQLLLSWMTLPDGSSILFRNLAEKDAHDRFHGFHLYKKIARACKDTAVPRKQLEKFSHFTFVPVVLAERCLFIEP